MYRVIWRYGLEEMGDVASDSFIDTKVLSSKYSPVFADIALIGAPEPVFSGPRVALRRKVLKSSLDILHEGHLDLAGYQHAFVVDFEEARKLRDRLQGERGVAHVEIQPRPSCALWFEKRGSKIEQQVIRASLADRPSDDYRRFQGYLDPAPGGVDAEFAWSRPGGRGEDVRIVDIEWGWNFRHEDLVDIQGGVIHGASQNDDHGTAVIGICSGDRNAFGVTGISSDAVIMGASATYDWATGKWNAALAIQAAVERLRPGDVILLEMHAAGPNSKGDRTQGYMPVEYWSSEFAAIRFATSRGIHVVQAAGNGWENLDDATYGGLFDRRRRDSGSILVGGGASAYQADPRAPLWWTNYGSRLDVQGWGEDIVTAGGHSQDDYYDLRYDDDPGRCYAQTFGGTSGASPIVAGVVACISGALRATGRRSLLPAEMRDLLVSTGTPQSGTKEIGPLPDLRRALDALGL